MKLISCAVFQCLPPAFLPLRCSNGECETLLSGPADQCPSDCSVHSQCSHCLATPGCGWCAFGGLNGIGLCMEGGLRGPSEGGSCALNSAGALSISSEQLLTLPGMKLLSSLSLATCKLPCICLSSLLLSAEVWCTHCNKPEQIKWIESWAAIESSDKLQQAEICVIN